MRFSQRKFRLILDLAMTALLPMLMAYSLIGEKFHEIAGSAMLVLFLAHHILNRKWHAAIPKGRYNAARILRTALDLALLVWMVLQPVSGILMSKHLYTFLQIPGVAATARELHLCLAYWGFLLVCVHAGTHLAAPLGKLKRRSKPAWLTLILAWLGVSAYGCVAFARRDLASYLFRRSAFVFFDFAEPRVFFFFDYAAIMALFLLVGTVLIAALSAQESGRKQE